MRAMLTRDDDYFVPLAAARAEGAPRAGRSVRLDPRRRVPRAARARLVGVRAVGERRDQRRGELARAEGERGRPDRRRQPRRRDPVLARTLLDLSQTAQINDSLKVGRHVLDGIGTINALHKPAVEQAGFAVLKAPDIPSILVETAFISQSRRGAEAAQRPPPARVRRVDRATASAATSRRTRRWLGATTPADRVAAAPTPTGCGRIAAMLRFFVAVRRCCRPLLFGLELTPWAQQYFVVPWTNALAAISAWLVTLFDPNVVATGKVAAQHDQRLRGVDRGRLQRRRGDDRAGRGDARLSGAVEAQARRARRRHRRRAGAQRRPRDQPVLPRAVGPSRCSSGRTCTSGRR